MAEPFADRLEARPVLDSEVVHHGLVWDVVRERVDLGGGAGEVTREFVHHPGAVAIVALDEHGRVAMVQQYRHPVRSYTWEVPAGLLDVDGEDPWLAAARELHEEADLAAEQWHVLVDYFSSPGGLDEALRVYLARGLSHVPEHDRHEREGEELGMPLRWVDLDEAQEAVLTGRVHNPSAVVGVLAAHAARARDWATLRPHDAPWPEHPAYGSRRSPAVDGPGRGGEAVSGAFGGSATGDPCPCGSGRPYDACCGPLHRGEGVARTAEQLMRSRYAAYARGDAAYLLATWHPRTRPDSLDLDPVPEWRRLEVLERQGGSEGDQHGMVEFRAHFRHDNRSGQLHERSRFSRRGGRWVYVDGDTS